MHYTPIADRISHDRLHELSRYLVRPLINHLSQKFRSLYKVNQEVAVDEAMIKFQEWSSLKQYMPLKPTKWGIKVSVLADSHNGYFSQFEVYTGKKGNTAETGLGTRVVKTPTAELKGKCHHVFFDNFFTSEHLLQDLLADDIYSCGTARKDRKGFPAEL